MIISKTINYFTFKKPLFNLKYVWQKYASHEQNVILWLHNWKEHPVNLFSARYMFTDQINDFQCQF